MKTTLAGKAKAKKQTTTVRSPKKLDGRTKEAKAARAAAWQRRLAEMPKVTIHERTAEALAAYRRDHPGESELYLVSSLLDYGLKGLLAGEIVWKCGLADDDDAGTKETAPPRPLANLAGFRKSLGNLIVACAESKSVKLSDHLDSRELEILRQLSKEAGQTPRQYLEAMVESGLKGGTKLPPADHVTLTVSLPLETATKLRKSARQDGTSIDTAAHILLDRGLQNVLLTSADFRRMARTVKKAETDLKSGEKVDLSFGGGGGGL